VDFTKLRSETRIQLKNAYYAFVDVEISPAAKTVVNAVTSDAACGLSLPYNSLPMIDDGLPSAEFVLRRIFDSEVSDVGKSLVNAVISDAPCGMSLPYNSLPAVDGAPSYVVAPSDSSKFWHSFKELHMRLHNTIWDSDGLRPPAWCTVVRGRIREAWHALLEKWDSIPFWVKAAGLGVCGLTMCYVIRWRRLTARSVARRVYDGQDDIAFCAYCSPEIMDETTMTLGSTYCKNFLVPAACPRCSWFWYMRGNRCASFRIGDRQYQFLGTYAGMRMQRERDIHCPMVNQLDVPNEYMFAHRFLQFHAGTISDMEHQPTFFFHSHTRAYRKASQWHAVVANNATLSVDDDSLSDDEDDGVVSATPQPVPSQPAVARSAPPAVSTASASGTTPSVTEIQRMRQLWQFVYDHGRMYPQSSLLYSAWTRTRELVGRAGDPVYDTTPATRAAMLGVDSRLQDQDYMTPPPGEEMMPVASSTARAVGPVTHPVTVHNTQDRTSVLAVLEGRSKVKKSVFPESDGTYPDLSFKKNSKAAQRVNKFWRKFNIAVLTDKAIDNAYQKLFAGKKFEEIAMSKFSTEDIARIRVELQTTVRPEDIGTRKANGKLEAIIKEGKPGRVVVDNTLQLLAVNIISTGIFQHLLFDHDDGIFYNMSIKHRPRGDVLDGFGKMMEKPWGNTAHDTCSWEIDQTGMELHERCNRHGEGLLGYTYNALMRINQRVSHKLNAEFVGLHTAKIVLDVKKGMQIRFRMKGFAFAKDKWFTAKFPDMYLDSGWALTSGVNFINELSGVFCSVTENPDHLFAFNTRTNKFRIQDGTFDWAFKSIPLYQTPASTEPASFPIKLRGMFEGDDGGGAASRCLADPRNGGGQGLIIRQQEDLGYSAKLKTIINGRIEIIGAHFPVRGGLICSDVPWIPDVKRYTSKLGTQTNVRITPNSQAARFLSLASMFAGRNEPFQRAFEWSATRVIEQYGSDSAFWTASIKTDGYNEIDRAFGDGTYCTYTMADIKAHYDRCANIVHQTSDVQIRMLNMSIASDVNANVVTRDDFAKLGLFADECRNFGGDDESAYSCLPACFR
jgi:hypothetical protein